MIKIPNKNKRFFAVLFGILLIVCQLQPLNPALLYAAEDEGVVDEYDSDSETEDSLAESDSDASGDEIDVPDSDSTDAEDPADTEPEDDPDEDANVADPADVDPIDEPEEVVETEDTDLPAEEEESIEDNRGPPEEENIEMLAEDEGPQLLADQIPVPSSTVLCFTSDTHNKDGNVAATRLGSWLDMVSEKYGGITLMAFGGDMANANASESAFWTLTQADMDQLDARGVKGVYTTGNHEYSPGNFSLNKNNTTRQYIEDAEGFEGSNFLLYCLGSKGGSWNNYSSTQNTTLRNYLNGVDNSKPIIIITHYPLHVNSYRTINGASDIIDTLNEAAAAGKKIVYLWGHNHTDSDQNYDQIFTPGDTITYSSGNSKKVQFYYGAAGCMSDSEYGTGSASVKGKGLVITINNKNQLSFTYLNASGANVTEPNNQTITEQEPVDATGVTIRETNPTVDEGRKLQLHLDYTPSDANANTAVTWSSSDTSVATVDQTGLVRGVKEGSATITVTATNGSYSTSRVVTVNHNDNPTSEETVNITPSTSNPEQSITINKGDTLIINVTNGSSNSSYNFTATLSKTGIVSNEGDSSVTIAAGATGTFTFTGVADGTVDITIQNNNSYGSSYARKGVVHVTVGDGGSGTDPVDPPTGDTVNITPTTDNPEESIKINVGDTLTINVTNGSSNSGYDFTATLSKTGIVSNTGSSSVNIAAGATGTFTFTGVTDGTVDITIQNNNSYGSSYARKGVVHVTVGDGGSGTDPVDPQSGDTVSITPSTDKPEESIKINVGDTLTINVTNGSSNSGYDFTATLGNSGIAQIQGDSTINIASGATAQFKVKGLAAGNVDITIQNSNTYGSQYTRVGIIHLTVGEGGGDDPVDPPTDGDTYILTDHIEDGGKYLIVSSKTNGTAYAMRNAGASSGGTAPGATRVTVNSETIVTDATDIVWTASTKLSGFNLTNDTDVFAGRGGTIYVYTQGSTSIYSDRYWTYDGTYLLFKGGDYTYEVYYDNAFTQNSFNTGDPSHPVYIYELSTSQTPVSDISVSPATLALKTGRTGTVTATVTPSGADKRVTWKSDKTSVATVDSTGKVTAVAAGEAHITATSVADSTKTATCTVTVTDPEPGEGTTYVLTDTLEAGKEYLIANGNTGSVYIVSNEAGSARQLKGVSVNVVDGTITLTDDSTIAKVAFTTESKGTAGGTTSVWLKNGSKYLYTDSSDGLRMVESSTQTSSNNSNKVWHYKGDGKDLLWFFNSNSADGYTDTSQTYKYYLEVSNGVFTDNHADSTSLANTNTPKIYLFVNDDGTTPVIPPTGDTVNITPTTSNPEESITINVGDTLTINTTNGSSNSAYNYTASISGNSGIAQIQGSSTINIAQGATGQFTVKGLAAGSVDINIVNDQSSSQYARRGTIHLTVVDSTPAHTHTYGDPTWAWTGNDTAGYTAATATFTCTAGDDTQIIEATVTSATSGNTTTYTATATFNGQTYTDTKTVEAPPVHTHTYGNPTWAWTGNDTAGYTAATATFTCTAGDDTQVVSANVTSVTSGNTTTYTATATFNGRSYTDTKTVTITVVVTYTFKNFTWTEKAGGGYTAVANYDGSDGSHPTVNANVTSVTTDATCETNGSTKYTASVSAANSLDSSSHQDTKTDVIAALGHNFGAWVTTTEPTCTRHGEQTRTCARCGRKETQELEMIAHDEVTIAGIEATCTEPGLSEGKKCKVCGKILQVQTEIPAKGHNFGPWTETKAATCTAAGEETHVCERCGDKETRPIAALGHNLEAHVAKAPTCTEAGNITYWSCTRCDKLFGDSAGTREVTQDDVVRPATGHTPSEAVRENEVAATCTTAGSYDEVVYCSVCKVEISRTTETVAALGHDFGEWTESKAPSCTEKGQRIRTCSRCGETETFDIPALGHTLTKTEAKAATCTEAGNSAYWTCSVCGKFFSDAEGKTEITEGSWVTEALGHAWKTPVYTWAEDNSTVTAKRVCERDDEHIETETVNTTYAVVTPAGDMTAGLGRFTSEAFENEAFEVQTKDIELPPTGYKVTYEWSEDNSKVTGTAVPYDTAAQTIIETVDAEYAVTNAPTCTETGIGTWTSKAFNATQFTVQTKEVTLDALGHKTTKTDAKDATCTEAGNSEYWTCSVCGKFFSDAEGKTEITEGSWVIEAFGHDWDTPEYTWAEDNSTVTAKRVCKRDDTHIETETVETTYEIVTPATETAPGVGKYTSKAFENAAFEVQTKEVEIEILPSDYELDKTSVTIPVNGSEQLALVSSSTGLTGKGTWTSADPKIATVDENGLVTAKKYGKTTIHVKMDNGYEADCAVQTLFSDVADKTAYFYNAVYWAADHDPVITQGYNLEYFGIGNACLRKEFILFLYRLAGNPSVSSADLKAIDQKFSDVKNESSTFRKAIAWGVKNGVINGYTSGEFAGTFGPEKTVTRREAVLMLWRYAGKPSAKETKLFNSFTDVSGKFSKKSDTYKAIMWAAETGISKGYSKQSDLPAGSGYKAPCYGCDLECLREQMIVFLYRFATM